MKAEQFHIFQFLLRRYLFSLYLTSPVQIISRFSTLSPHKKKPSYCSCSFSITVQRPSVKELLLSLWWRRVLTWGKSICLPLQQALSNYIQREGSREGEREAEWDIDLQELIDLVSQMLVITTTTTEILQGTEQNLYVIFLLTKQCFLHPSTLSPK